MIAPLYGNYWNLRWADKLGNPFQSPSWPASVIQQGHRLSYTNILSKWEAAYLASPKSETIRKFHLIFLRVTAPNPTVWGQVKYVGQVCHNTDMFQRNQKLLQQ